MRGYTSNIIIIEVCKLYEECNTVNEVIEEIFKNCLVIKYNKVDNDSELFGF